MREIDRREFVKGVGIRVYVDGNWASAGGFGQVTHHDRSNSRG